MANSPRPEAGPKRAEPFVNQDAESHVLAHNYAADDERDMETMDDATGCEFVDDRIRQLE